MRHPYHLRNHHVNIRFQDNDGDNWIAIWQMRVKFGMSVEFIPGELTPTGIRFCNLTSGEERFLELPEAEIPNEQQLEERGKEDALREMLGRAE